MAGIYNRAVTLTSGAGFTTGARPKGVLLMPGDSCDVQDIYGLTIGMTSGSGVNAIPFLLPIQISKCTGVTGSPKVLF
tara:strand:- start:552 stop:785 length:234 start_codon:yes stop_codon:yes gene_type:complete